MRGRTGRRAGALIGLVALALVGGCSKGYETGEIEEARVGSGDLVATMGVETAGEVVELTLYVTNGTEEPIELEFSSGQRFDFQVARMDGEEPGETLWTWSADKSFLQALGTETLAPGASLRYSAEWHSGGLRGEFIARGDVVSTSHPVRQSARFELAGDE